MVTKREDLINFYFFLLFLVRVSLVINFGFFTSILIRYRSKNYLLKKITEIYIDLYLFLIIEQENGFQFAPTNSTNKKFKTWAKVRLPRTWQRQPNFCCFSFVTTSPFIEQENGFQFTYQELGKPEGELKKVKIRIIEEI
jgi:hypothetical protein